MARGRLITVEGLDGAGKSTLASGLAMVLREDGQPVLLLREPGGVAAAERIRALVKDPELRVGARAEALLFAAARAQLVEETLEPTLAAGQTVLLDRFVDSSLAYQGGGRELGVDAVRRINALACAGIAPDLTLYLRVPPDVGRERQAGRGEALDRLEQEDDAFFTRIEAVYDALAEAEPERIRVIDASATPLEMLQAARAAVRELL